jgi:hypothetical protein
VLGRRAEAVEEVERLLADLGGADADLPLLVEAKATRSRLAAAPRPR